MAQVTGSFISAVRDACRNGLLDWSPRLMLAMYECNIQASSRVLSVNVLQFDTDNVAQLMCSERSMASLRSGEAVSSQKR